VFAKPAPLVLNAPSNPGAVEVVDPVVLAPMAGVTNAAFRRLCTEQGAGLAICEMITGRGLVIGDHKTVDMMTFWPDEPIRSVQLYGTDAASLDVAVGIAADAFGAQHIDLNFGCPVKKVTRKGGGGVLPWKLDLFAAIVDSCVKSADRYGVPVTVKIRIGIDPEHITYLDAARIAEDHGAAAVCLHARTVAQAYSGKAHWEAISTLVAALDIPVLGNGDIWEGRDAVAMMSETGCAGVEIGRGCLGRPWLFADIRDALNGVEHTTLPNLGKVAALVRRHGELLTELMGEQHAMADLRKHTGWYFKGFPLGGDLRLAFSQVKTLDQLDELLNQLDPDAPYPERELGRPRGRQGTPNSHVVMPYGWLDDRSGLDLDLSEAELDISGG
jgi:nifR3 family TIM-barrel protein